MKETKMEARFLTLCLMLIDAELALFIEADISTMLEHSLLARLDMMLMSARLIPALGVRVFVMTPVELKGSAFCRDKATRWCDLQCFAVDQHNGTHANQPKTEKHSGTCLLIRQDTLNAAQRFHLLHTTCLPCEQKSLKM